jgi:PBP1b-binding outer membrane lipoprotein LpoB
MKRLAPLTLIATTALVLAGCSGDTDAYDEPTEMGVAMATDYYNEAADQTYGPELTPSEFETRAKDVCDRLPEEPTEQDFDNLIEALAEEDSRFHTGATQALVLHGSGAFCNDKFEHAHGD